ncbi:MAG: DUF427 domain-containing protein [Bacteroidetes bacterium]|nr:DUF427 domain-containing protein [Bacteroidota bacterium]
MVQAKWNGAILAQSNETIIVEGNHYFPKEDIRFQYFKESDEHTFCPWKGTASYYDIEVDGNVNHGGAWYYPNPKPKAAEIKDMVAFWRGIKVEEIN